MNFGNFGKTMGKVSGMMPRAGGMMGGGGMSGGFNPRGGMGAASSPFGQAMQARQGLGGGGMGMGSGPGAMAAGALLSDERSKERITELEDELQRTYAALGGKPATADVNPQAPDTAALDAAYRKPSSNSYEYRDPTAQGAAPGRQVGPMSDELRDLPGVVTPGPDGMDRVDPGRLTMANTSEIANLRRELDALNGRIGGGQSNPDGTY